MVIVEALDPGRGHSPFPVIVWTRVPEVHVPVHHEYVFRHSLSTSRFLPICLLLFTIRGSVSNQFSFSGFAASPNTAIRWPPSPAASFRART